MTAVALTLLQNLYSRSGPLFGNSLREFTPQQRSDAKSVLLHHHDIQNFLQVLCLCIRCDPLLTLVQGDEEELTRLLAESGVAERVEVDENGGRSRSCIANFQVLIFESWTTSQPYSNRVLKADLVRFQSWCKRP